MNHIVFHNDVDGVVSAALFQCACPGDRFNYTDSILYPVQSTMRGNIKKIIDRVSKEDSLAIVDFESDPRADIWIDHHFSPDLGMTKIKNDKIFYDPAAKSAAQLIYDAYYRGTASENEILSTIDMVNTIDSALYPDVKFIFESDHPLMILRAYLETAFPSDMMYCRIVEMLVSTGFNVATALKRTRIDYESVENIKNIAKKILKDMVVFSGCSVVNQTRQNQYPRYAEYFVKPELEYAIRITISGPHQKYIQIGHSQWCGKCNTKNLGEFMRNLSYVKGGGHFNVAAGVIKNEDEQKFLDDVDLHFHKDDDMMEKYGVDKEDPVEAKAQELVKTGMDLNKAREKSQQEKETNAGNESKL